MGHTCVSNIFRRFMLLEENDERGQNRMWFPEKKPFFRFSLDFTLVEVASVQFRKHDVNILVKNFVKNPCRDACQDFNPDSRMEQKNKRSRHVLMHV